MSCGLFSTGMCAQQEHLVEIKGVQWSLSLHTCAEQVIFDIYQIKMVNSLNFQLTNSENVLHSW